MTNTSGNPVIQTAGLTKIFRDFWGHQKVIAVDQLDLEVFPHEVFGLLGPNGSGKSTTIKMLLGLLFTSKGWAKVLGENPGDVKTNARIGYLPEESYLYPFLNARETLDFYGRLFGLTRHQRKQRTDSLLDMVGLGAVSRRPIGEFSKGMTRRIGLAQALINDPDLLILDEPTSGMDPIGTRQIKDLIRELGQRGKSVLLCSHLMADVEDVCDRICILYGGKVQSQGQVSELLKRSEITQINCNRLSKQAIEKIEGVIKQECPNSSIEVLNPQDRLEDYFLRTVEIAQAAAIATSGATMGAGASDFLTSGVTQTDDAGTVIEQLLGDTQKTADKKAAQLEATKRIEVEKVEKADLGRREVIDSLIKTTEPVGPLKSKKDDDRTSPAVPLEPVNPVPSPGAVDHSVIDGLLSNDPTKKKTNEKSSHNKDQDPSS
ncbi:MAG: ABC transporter ATP-binding protein [Phycisphaerae bacterium]|nr:ABC transporter ATP-binding protein [Phycisphaerae bacterium]